MQDVIRANGEAGLHFFERATMRFFDSRVCPDTLAEGPGGVFFVTSEQFRGSDGVRAARLYTVRHFYPETGDVTTAGTFQKHASRESAARAAKAMAEGGSK